MRKYLTLLVLIIASSIISYSQIDSIIYSRYSPGNFYYNFWISSKVAYISTTKELKRDSLKTKNKQLLISDKYYSDLISMIDIDKFNNYKDYYKGASIASNITYKSLSIKQKDKWKTIKGDNYSFPEELNQFCKKIDSLMLLDFSTWTTTDLNLDFFNKIKVDSLLIYLIKSDTINTKGYYLLKDNNLIEFQKETSFFQKIDPLLIERNLKVEDKYLIILNSIDIFEPNSNIIKTDGKYYKNQSYLWYKDEDEILKKYLNNNNWR
jgi:hypothetical protein